MREQDRPTAIFAFNDLGAINVYRAARQHSISLPEQLSIIGFDDVYPAASMCPSLTTIRQPFDLIARQCIDLILEAREGKVDQNYFILPHTACRTRKLRIAITAVTCNGTQNQLPRSTHAYAIRLCHKHLLLFTR